MKSARPPAASTAASAGAIPGDECVYTSIPVSVPVTPGTLVRGYHVARLGRALRRGLISGPDLIGVLQALDAFTNDTVFYDQAPGGEQ
jgi:hypothetical protein